MTSGGFYLMARGWMDNPALQTSEPFSRPQAWIWLIEHAAYAETRQDVGGKTVTVFRGQLSTSYRMLGAEWRRPIAWVQRFIRRLQTDTMVDTATDTGRLLITICNYDKYQCAPRAGDTPPDTPAIRERYTGDTQKNQGKESKREESPRGRGRETPPTQGALLVPLPGGRPAADPPTPRGPHGMPAEVGQMIAAFDAARASAFGQPLARPWPHAMDCVTAQQWLTLGVAKGRAPAEVVAVAAAVMDADHRRRASRSPTDPPATLAFHTAAISRALAQPQTPPEAPADVQQPANRQKRPGDRPGRHQPCTGESVAHAAAFDAMAGRLEAAGYAPGKREGGG